jgi:RNA polymerase sigma-70 factor, ECF subfamily
MNGLLAAAGRGDGEAFDLVLTQLSGSIKHLVATMVRDPAQAEEVTQEVLFEMWRTAVRYDSRKGSATAWALTIARRRAIDRVRSMTARSVRERRNMMATVPADAVSWDQVSEAVEATLDREQLLHCLDKLSDPQLQSVVLAFYGGYSHTEIATLLGLPLGTVKARIRGALASLRLCMQARGRPGPEAGGPCRGPCRGPWRERSREK